MASITGNVFTTEMLSSKGMASTKRISFDLKEYLPLKETASIKFGGFHSKGWLPLKKWLPLKGMASTRRNGFHQKEWFPLKRI